MTLNVKDEDAAIPLSPDELSTLLRFLGQLFLYELNETSREQLLGELSESWRSVGGALPAQSLTELQSDFCQLFANPKTYVAPFQSVWTTGQLDGPSAQSMRRYLQLSGYGDLYPSDEIPDHFGLQLDVAGWMLSASGESPVVEQVATEFVNGHVRWGLHMLARVEADAQTEFYRSAAVVTRRVVEELTVALAVDG